jgi:hypothetical protein
LSPDGFNLRRAEFRQLSGEDIFILNLFDFRLLSLDIFRGNITQTLLSPFALYFLSESVLCILTKQYTLPKKILFILIHLLKGPTAEGCNGIPSNGENHTRASEKRCGLHLMVIDLAAEFYISSFWLLFSINSSYKKD